MTMKIIWMFAMIVCFSEILLSEYLLSGKITMQIFLSIMQKKKNNDIFNKYAQVLLGVGCVSYVSCMGCMIYVSCMKYVTTNYISEHNESCETTVTIQSRKTFKLKKIGQNKIGPWPAWTWLDLAVKKKIIKIFDFLVFVFVLISTFLVLFFAQLLCAGCSLGWIGLLGEGEENNADIYFHIMSGGGALQSKIHIFHIHISRVVIQILMQFIPGYNITDCKISSCLGMAHCRTRYYHMIFAGLISDTYLMKSFWKLDAIYIRV